MVCNKCPRSSPMLLPRSPPRRGEDRAIAFRRKLRGKCFRCLAPAIVWLTAMARFGVSPATAPATGSETAGSTRCPAKQPSALGRLTLPGRLLSVCAILWIGHGLRLLLPQFVCSR